MSKPSYATDVTERLTGFGDQSNLPKLNDILEFPNVSRACFNDPGVKSLNKHRSTCSGPVAFTGTADAEEDIAHFATALENSPPTDAFIKPEYQAIIDAGFNLQLDCLDLAMTCHREFQGRRQARLDR